MAEDEEQPGAPEEPGVPEEPGAGSPEPAEGGDVAASGAAGEPSDGAAEEPAAETPEPPAEGGELAASGAAGEPSDGAAEEPADPAEEPAAPAAEEPPAAPAEEPAAPAAEEPAAPAAEEPAAPAAEQPAGEERPRRERGAEGGKKPDVVPGAHLEPDLVLESDRREGEDDEFARYRDSDPEAELAAEAGESPASTDEAAAPAPRRTIDLAADARYKATGKRKTAVARVIVKPGSGSYQVNGRTLEEFFPRPTLQRTARMPLETAGYETRMDVVARIHGGGVSSQADALRHGIARALVEADPNLRTELKRRGFLTRDAREKERKKAGLKKARKRPQFSKR
jgi:small subunit ribosomal protein S9